MMSYQWCTEYILLFSWILFDIMEVQVKWTFVVLCYSQQTDCKQQVGVETKHSLGSHDEHYLHERNKDAAEEAWSVRLNGFLKRLLIGCEVWVHDILHVKGFDNWEMI